MTVSDGSTSSAPGTPGGSAVTLRTADGVEIAATHFRASTQLADRVVVINSATGVRRDYYAAFARALAAANIPTLTYDYRGIGDSRPATLRGYQATMLAWGTHDASAALAWMHEHHPTSRLLVVGHSVGGQLMGAAGSSVLVAGAVVVGAQHGYYGNWDPPHRYVFAVGAHVLMPALTHALGYFPSPRFGMGEPLPKGVALEWARWCRSRDYLFDRVPMEVANRYGRLAIPILAFSFSDDAIAPRRAAARLLERYSAARVTHRHLRPRDLGVPSIGHFGFFRDRFRTTLWAEAIAFLAKV
jgi:predicted alpha/beta hydrolase